MKSHRDPGSREEGPGQVISSSKPPDSETHLVDDGREGVLADVGEAGSLDPAPETFDGIELGCIGREPDDAQPGLLPDKLLHLLGTVRLQSVPDQDDLPSQVAQKMAEEDQDLRRAHFASVEAKQHSAAAIATIGQRSDRRHALPAAHLRPQHRCLSPRSPRTTDDGALREAALV